MLQACCIICTVLLASERRSQILTVDLQRDVNSLTQDMALTVAEAASQALWGAGYHSSLQGISPSLEQIGTLSRLGNLCIA